MTVVLQIVWGESHAVEQRTSLDLLVKTSKLTTM